MTAKIIVCVAAQRAIVAVHHHGRMEPCREFSPDSEGQREFGDLLHAHHGYPVYLMVDSVEEDYHAETMPHVTGSAHQELVQRKLRQLYRNTSYCTAWVQGRESGKRRDDRYMFVALTNTDILRPWLETLHAMHAAVAGVYLLPMVSQELLARLSLNLQDLLLVSRHFGGLRQSYFQGGQIKASRLALIDQEQDTPARLASEIGKTRLYLNSLRLMPREAKLTVLLLDADADMEALQQLLRNEPGIGCHCLKRKELAARLGGLTLTCPYALHMAVLGQRPPANNLAPSGTTRFFRYYQQRRLLQGASLAVAAAAMMWAGSNLYQKYQLNMELREVEVQTRDELARYAEVTKTFPQAPASADSLEKAVQIAAQITRHARTPEVMMQAVSRALETSPEIMLSRLSWKHHEDGRETRPDRAPDAAGIQESGFVEGEVRSFQGDYRAAMASINRLAEKLRHDPAVASVNVVQMPLNIQSSTALSGNTLDSMSDSGNIRAEFKLMIVLRGRS